MPQTHEKPRDLWTDQAFILAHGQEAKRLGKPLFLGNLQRAGWTGRIPTYLIWCEPCRDRENGGFTVAHEAGYARRLACSVCRKRYDQLLLGRLVKDAALNPHRHPRFLAFLLLVAVLAALALR